MKALLLSLFLLSSCGAIRVTPRACSTDAIWGTKILKAHTIDEKPIYRTFEEDEEVLSEIPSTEKVQEFKTKEVFFVLADVTVRLKDLLADYNVNCADVKKISLRMDSKFFFWRELTIKIYQ